MKETRALLALERNDFSWSSWEDQDQAISEIDLIVTELENGSVPDIGALFAPTGPIQEVSISSGWGEEFIELAQRFDHEYERVRNQT
ncbi:MAG TPA: hypothetical protein VK206_17425 [Anaerolineales bacterium]|nr:hypothetical protein [Anaerolineales bacterium]